MRTLAMKRTAEARRRGTATAVTLIMSLVLVTAASSLLSLTQGARTVTESHYSYHAMQNALERGVDQALYAFGQYRKGGFTAWPAGWSGSVGTGYGRAFTNVDLGNNRTVTLKVTIRNLPTDSGGKDAAGNLILPYVVAEASYDGAGLPGSGPYSRQILAILQPVANASSTGSPGMIVKDAINFNGNGSSFDSYTSLPPATGLTTSYPYGATYTVDGKTYTNISDKITVASIATYSNLFDPIGDKGTVYGYVLVGGGDAKAATGGLHVYGADSATTYLKKGADPARIASGYSTDMTVAATPAVAWGAITPAKKGTTTLAGSLDPKTPIYYTSDGSNLANIVVQGHVALRLTGNLSMSGQDQILIDNGDTSSGSSLVIYTAGNIDIKGNGIVNGGGAKAGPDSLQTTKLTVYGTAQKPGGQSFTLSGNGAFSGNIIAPNANITFNGGGSRGVYYGALKAYTVTANGGVDFHYDVALGGGAPSVTIGGYPVSYWVEPKNKVAMSKYGL